MINFGLEPLGSKKSVGQADPQNPTPTTPDGKPAPTPGTTGGIGGTITALLHNILSSPNQGGAGMSQDGDFDPNQYLESTLSKAQKGGGEGIGKLIGGFIKMLGI